MSKWTFIFYYGAVAVIRLIMCFVSRMWHLLTSGLLSFYEVSNEMRFLCISFICLFTPEILLYWDMKISSVQNLNLPAVVMPPEARLCHSAHYQGWPIEIVLCSMALHISRLGFSSFSCDVLSKNGFLLGYKECVKDAVPSWRISHFKCYCRIFFLNEQITAKQNVIF